MSMKQTLLVFSVVLLATVLLYNKAKSYSSVATPDVSAECKPRLMVDEVEFLCDTVNQGESATSEPILLRNIGDAALVISDIKSGCRCMPVEETLPLTILPGDAHPLVFKIDTRETQGEYRKLVTIMSNAVNAPVQSFEICGRVIPRISLSPQLVKLGVLHSSLSPDERSFEINVTTRPADNVVVDKVPKGIQYDKVVSNKPGQWTFLFVVEMQEEPLMIEGEIVFKSQSGDSVATARADVHCSIFNDCIVSPYPLAIGVSATGKTRIKHCQLEFIKPEVTSINVLFLPPCILNAVVEEEIPMKTYRIRFEVYSREVGVLSEQDVVVSFETSLGDRRVLRIPVSGMFYAI